MTSPTLDMMTIGRSSVDPYGQRIDGRLEKIGRFSKAIGRSPTNATFGAARLGLKTGLAMRSIRIRP